MAARTTHYIPAPSKKADGREPFIVAIAHLDDADASTRTRTGNRFATVAVLAAYIAGTWVDAYSSPA